MAFYTLGQVIAELEKIRADEGENIRVAVFSGAREEQTVEEIGVWTAGPDVRLQGVKPDEFFVVLSGAA